MIQQIVKYFMKSAKKSIDVKFLMLLEKISQLVYLLLASTSLKGARSLFKLVQIDRYLKKCKLVVI